MGRLFSVVLQVRKSHKGIRVQGLVLSCPGFRI
jgi:hypothetical protein